MRLLHLQQKQKTQKIRKANMKNKLIIVVAVLSMMAQGCATTPETIAFRTTNTITFSVDVARKAWNDYCAKGLATVNQVDIVAKAYTKYQLTMAATQATIVEYKMNPNEDKLSRIMSTVQASADEVVALINSFMGKEIKI